MAQWVALVCAGVWALFSVYLSIVERPGRSIDIRAPAFVLYRRISSVGVPLFILLIFIGSGAGIYVWIQTRSNEFVIGALILLFMFPLSAVFVKPLNQVALETQTGNVAKAVEQVFTRWRWVHLLRTVLAIVAFVCFVLGSTT